MKFGYKSPRQLLGWMFLTLSHLPMYGGHRWRFLKWAGVKFNLPNKGHKQVYIGTNVEIDTAYPEEIEIGNLVQITTGCALLTHYMTTDEEGHIVWHKGHIKIEDGVFIGAHTVITKPVTIGKGSIVGAGSVVTKDIPPHEIWAGVPARFIKKINTTK